MAEIFHVVPVAIHEQIVVSAYRHRGYTADEAEKAAKLATAATTHGIRTHNAIKALHLDELFGSKAGGCVPGAQVRKLSSRFDATEVWDANKKLGQAVAWDAIERCMALADRHGTGTISVDNAFHYLWGGGYVMEAARRGYIAYTNCTASLAEVVPFRGVHPTLGTNPHSWGFPTTDAIGYPIVIDWATSVIAMGRVQQLKREGKTLPHGAAVDASGKPTTDPDAAVALLPFGDHKGYGLSLINEIVAGFIGGSLPTIRSRAPVAGEKQGCAFFFQVIHPEAISGAAFPLAARRATTSRPSSPTSSATATPAACSPANSKPRRRNAPVGLAGCFFPAPRSPPSTSWPERRAWPKSMLPPCRRPEPRLHTPHSPT